MAHQCCSTTLAAPCSNTNSSSFLRSKTAPAITITASHLSSSDSPTTVTPAHPAPTPSRQSSQLPLEASTNGPVESAHDQASKTECETEETGIEESNLHFSSEDFRSSASAQASPSYSKQDPEPPPPYSEALSPLQSFASYMATTGGSSIITQVQQGPLPLNSLADSSGTGEEHLTLDLRRTQFVLSRDELLTLPEFVLLSLFPNGLFPDGQMSSFHDDGVYTVDFDPVCLQYMLDFFRKVSATITVAPREDDAGQESREAPSSPTSVLQDRAGIIVLREDLDFYVIPPTPNITHEEMMEIKRAAGQVLLKQNGIFSGLRRTDDTGTTEQHLIEMLTAGGFNADDTWGHRAGEPNKAEICSLALARLRTGSAEAKDSNMVGMAQKLLLFWRKPARRCWWEGLQLEGVEGVQGKPLKVWIRRVWTLEMSVIGLR